MRIAVLSDIHGNHEALTSVLEDLKKQNASTVISLGDNIGYGADSEAVIHTVRSLNITSVLGNHELASIDKKVRAWFRKDAETAISHAIKSLSDTSLSFIKSLSSALQLENCYFVHGFPPNSARLYLTYVDDDEVFKTLNTLTESVCFVGHTHKLCIVYAKNGRIYRDVPETGKTQLKKGEKYIINVGSVGQPRDGSGNARYVIWDTVDFELEIRSVCYDVKTASAKIISAGIPEKYARILEGRVIF